MGVHFDGATNLRRLRKMSPDKAGYKQGGDIYMYIFLRADCHEGVRVSTNSLRLRYKVAIMRKTSSGVTIHGQLREEDREACEASRTRTVTAAGGLLFAHVEHARAFACASIARPSHSDASKDPKIRANHIGEFRAAMP